MEPLSLASDLEKCSSCGQFIPATEFDCPNCGRRRKTPVHISALRQTGAAKPFVAQVATALAWVALIGGALSLIAGITDSMNPHVSGGYGEFAAGIGLLFSSIIWFLGARAITLLAQIAANTKK